MIDELYGRMDRCTHIHFIGIGGISMSSLAMIAAERGYSVSGSDSVESDMTRKLKTVGIRVMRGNSPENLPKDIDPDRLCVVYSAAVRSENSELCAAVSLGAAVVGRMDIMGYLMRDIPCRIGVSGMHGKSTVCGMLAQISLASGEDDSILCGAELPSLGGAFKIGKSERAVFEACEYKNSFLKFAPTVAVITNIEEEHMDFFRDRSDIRRSFLSYANGAERLVAGIDSPMVRDMLADVKVPVLTCSARDRGADYYADNISFRLGAASFELFFQGSRVLSAELRVVGEHNLFNAVIAAATALSAGFSPGCVEAGLSAFTGASRRMEYRGRLRGAVLYDDYAHHPTEIRATLAAARQMGFKFISCAFQPHTFSRTARFFCDFVRAFSDADEVLFADVFPAREENAYGVSSRELATATPNGYYVPTAELIASHFRRIAAPNVLLLTMGAGKLDQVAELIPELIRG